MSDLRKRKVETEDDKSSEKQTASGTESDHVRKHFTFFSKYRITSIYIKLTSLTV